MLKVSCPLFTLESEFIPVVIIHVTLIYFLLYFSPHFSLRKTAFPIVILHIFTMWGVKLFWMVPNVFGSSYLLIRMEVIKQ